MSLLDSKITELKINWINYENVTETSIMDVNQEYLGKISSDGLPRLQYTLYDTNDALILNSFKTDYSGKGFTLKNPQGKLIGRLRERGSGFLKKKIVLEEDDESIILVEEKIKKGNTEIKNNEGKKIAKLNFGYEEGWKGSFLGGKIYFNLKIDDSKYNRLALLGFYLSLFHDRVEIPKSPSQSGE